MRDREQELQEMGEERERLESTVYAVVSKSKYIISIRSSEEAARDMLKDWPGATVEKHEVTE